MYEEGVGTFPAFRITSTGLSWLSQNSHMLELHADAPSAAIRKKPSIRAMHPDELSDDDIPF
jgi:hypothetical protein